MDGIFNFPAVSPASFFLDFPVLSDVSSDVGGAGSFDEDAVDTFGAGVLDLSRCGVPLNDAGSDSIRRPVPLKGVGPGVLLRPLVGLGTTMLSIGGSAGVDSARSLFATLAEGPLLLACAFAAGCVFAALAERAFSGGLDGGSLLLTRAFAAGGCTEGSRLLALAFAIALVSEAARFPSIFDATGGGSIFGVGFWARGADLALTRWSLSANLAASGLETLFLIAVLPPPGGGGGGGGAMPAGTATGPGRKTICIISSLEVLVASLPLTPFTCVPFVCF